jgi:ribosomal protein S27E
MEFDPESGKLKCGYCGSTMEVPQEGLRAIQEHALQEYLGAALSQHLGQMSGTAVELNCASCGATVVLEPPATAGACSFCGANIVTQAKAADPLIAPDGVLPFAVKNNDATSRVKTWLATRWFAPNALKRVATPEGIHGVYVPFWTFDADTGSEYRGERGDHYWVTETYWTTDANGKQVQQTRQVRRTRWTPVSGHVEVGFDDILIPATKAVVRQRLDELEPWDLDQLKPYEPGYLAGFQAQRYQVDLPAGLAHAQEVMAGTIRDAVDRDIGGDEQRIHSVDTSYQNETFKHLLLPVWIGAYRFREKVYQVAVNARTGEVQGERPWSAWKIAGLVLVIVFVVLVLVVLFRN